MTAPNPDTIVHHFPQTHTPVPSLRVLGIGYYPHKRSVVTEAYEAYGFAFVFSGKGWFRTRTGSRQSVTAPFFFWIRPGVSNHYGPDEGTCWEERFFTLGGERTVEWEAQGWIPPAQRAYLLQKAGEVERFHKQVYKDFLSLEPDRIAGAKLEIERLVYELGRGVRNMRGTPSNESRIEAELKNWRKAPATPVDFEVVAASLGLSYSRFRHLFRKHVASSPYQYLLGLRIQQAQQLLDSRTHSIKEIASLSGFDSVESFDPPSAALST